MERKDYFGTCPYCGAHLDPGEPCDCPEAVNEREKGGRRNEQ